MKDVIIGFGISGLLWKYYFPESEVYYKKIGGQMNSLTTPPIFIHYTWETKRLLKDLDLKAKKTNCQIRYYYDGKIHKFLDIEKRKEMVIKKINMYGKKIRNLFPQDLNLSTMSNKIKIFDIKSSTLFSKIIENIKKDKIFEKEVILINTLDKEIILNDYSQIKYDRLISTIPAVDFERIAFDFSFNKHFEYYPSTIVLTDFLLPEFEKFKTGILYVIDNKYPFTRIGFSEKDNNKFTYEITGIVRKEELLKFFEQKNILDISYQNIGIIKSNPVQDTKDMIFLGRLAQWSHEIKIQQVLKKIYYYLDGGDKYD